MAIQLSGSLVMLGNIVASGGITGSFSGSATTASYADTLGGLPSSSFASASTFITVSSSFASTSGSISSRVTLIEGQCATTGSNNFTAPQQISDVSNAISFTSTASLYTEGGLRVKGSSFISGTAYFNNITVYGTSSISYITSSQVAIGTNIITLNTDTPSIRFGGISVFDSGSNNLGTGSLFWDSEKDRWIYANPSGSSYDGGMIISGPRNTSGLGNEQGTLSNYVMKGQGGDHITSSQIIDDGTTVRIPGNFQVTGSLSGSNAMFSGGVTTNAYSYLYGLRISGNDTGNTIYQATGALGISTNNSAITFNPSLTTALTLASNGAATFASSVTTNGVVYANDNIRIYAANQFWFNNAFRGQIVPYSAYGGGTDYSPFFTSETSLAFGVAGNATKALMIAASGNVGIGTASPYSKLDVNNGNIRMGEILNSASAYIGKQYSANSNFYSSIQFYSTTGEDAIIFNTHLSGVRAGESMRINGSGFVQAPYLNGKAYGETSGAGTGTSIIDTGIYYSSGDYGGYGAASCYLVTLKANPNAGGSGAYYSSLVGYVVTYTGWNGSAVTVYATYVALAAGNGGGNLTITPTFWNGSTESAAVNNSVISSYQLRIKISGYNSSYTGYAQSFYMTKLS